MGMALLLIVSDSRSQQSLPVDALRIDTLQSEEKDTARRAVSGVDTVVTYTSTDSIVYSLSSRTMTLFGKGDIKYRQMRLKSEEIDINWDTAVMDARGVPDTSDTSKSRRGKKYRGTPVMVDGGEEYRGYELSYNFRTQKGRIDLGETEMDKGYYHGETIKKVDKDILFVQDGTYTTCDEEDPHFYFSSPKMKVVMQDKVVAEPVYLYISDVPVFALPFGVFPNKGGRRSGIIAPAYVDDPARGRGLLHLGYYWATSDYMDWNARSDLYSKGGWAAYSDLRYASRYSFTGSVGGEYKQLHTGESNDPDRTKEEAYRATIRHNQEINPTTRLDVNFIFASNNSFRTTNNLQQALDQAIFSNATLSKSWEGTPNSMTLSISRTQNLQNGSITEVLPSLSFNRSQSYPFRSKKSGGSSEMEWYDLIGYNYGAQFANDRAKTHQSVPIKDTTGGITTFKTVDGFGRSERQGLTQNVGFSASPKLGYFTITPQVSFQDSRSRSFARSLVPDPQDSFSVAAVQREQWLVSGSFSSGVSTGTRLYGILQPDALGVSAFRHTLSPSLGMTYSKQVYGRNVPKHQLVASLNVGNIFEMKTTPTLGDSAAEGSKVQLLNVGAGVSYNFAADSLNFSPIALNYRTNIAGVLDISGNTGFDLYKFESGRRVNKFLIDEEGRLARMTSFGLNLSTSLSGEKKKKTAAPQAAGEPTEAEEDTAEAAPPFRSGYSGLYSEEEPDLSIPWSLQLSWDFSENKVPGQRSRSSNLRGTLGFNLTENWKVTVGGSYDVLNREPAAPNVQIYRDLHCWEMVFDWIPIGTVRRFMLEIRLKAPQLRDIKVTKQRSSRSIY
jgi:hypothetical protein